MLLNGAKFCPFCGNDVIKSDLIDGELRAWCVNCLAVGPTRHFGPDGTAAGAWGDRAVDDGAAELRAGAELAQAHADRTIMLGLWLATVPPDVLLTLLPADPGDRDRLAAALDAADLQASAESHTAAGRAIITRIVRVAAVVAGGAR